MTTPVTTTVITPVTTTIITPVTTLVTPPTAAATTTTPTTTPTTGGAYGFVSAGPTCPVERQGQPCPPQPVAATVDAQNGAGRVVATTRSDGSGRYQISLPGGTYVLTATTGGTYPRCRSTQVTVATGALTRADIGCDTGIR